MSYQPPFTLTPAIVRLIADISEALGRLSIQADKATGLLLRRLNRIRTIQCSLAIEGNTLTREQSTAILDGKRLLAPQIASSVFHYEFEFIHPFRDVNGRMGCLWQTLILGQWQPLLVHIPVESLVHAHQREYYRAIQASTAKSDSAPFITFMLTMLGTAITEFAPQVSPQVISLLRWLRGSMSRDALQAALQPKNRKSFRTRYLLPALEAGLVAMTLPEKPNSRLHQYQLTDAGTAMRQTSC